MRHSTVMQTLRLASWFSSCNAVRRATLITYSKYTPHPATCAMMSAASHSRAAVRLSAVDPELERLHTLALIPIPPPQSAGPACKPP
jgi:hypothetical protein